MNMVLFIIGYILIWIAAGVNRNEGSRIKALSWFYFLQLILIIADTILILYSHDKFK